MVNITIVGTGKLALTLTLGFLRAINAGALDAKLVIIGRSENGLEEFSNLVSEKITTTTRYEAVQNADYCIICIVPSGVQELYPKLRKILGKVLFTKTVISLTSGVNITLAKDLLGVYHPRLVCGTTTTNVAYRLGYSVFCGLDGNRSALPHVVTLFELLGKTQVVKGGYKKVLKYILTIGSGNAFDASFLWSFTNYEKQRGNQTPHRRRLRSISMFFSRALRNGNTLEYLLNARTRARRSMVSYIKAKLRYLVEELGYEPNFALKLILETMTLTIEVIRKNSIEKESIENHNKKVVTKGGCTEKGILDFEIELEKVFNVNLPEPNFSGFDDRYREIMRPVYKRTLTFQKEARLKA